MYFCKVCSKYFSQKKRQKNELWKKYSVRKQTQQQIAAQVGKSREWVNIQLKKSVKYRGKNEPIQPQKIVLIVDTTFYQQFGLMVFRSSNLKKNLLWKIVDTETNDEYRSGIQELIDDDWDVVAIVADGRPGISKLFPDIPFQKCHFHQFQTVTQCISKNPQLQASRELRQIMFWLKQTDYDSFKSLLIQWHEKWKKFLAEKTINPITGKSHFTHQRLRRAFFSVRRNLDYLFTFQFHSTELQIPNTTNSLDGYFSHLNNKLNIHRGASKSTQINLISNLIFQ